MIGGNLHLFISDITRQHVALCHCHTMQSYNNGGSLVEACSFIQRITENIPSSGLSAKCLLAWLQSVI